MLIEESDAEWIIPIELTQTGSIMFFYFIPKNMASFELEIKNKMLKRCFINSDFKISFTIQISHLITRINA